MAGLFHWGAEGEWDGRYSLGSVFRTSIEVAGLFHWGAEGEWDGPEISRDELNALPDVTLV